MPLPDLLSVTGIALWLGYEVVVRDRSQSGTRSWRAGGGDRGSTYLIIAGYLLSGALVAVLHSMAAGHVPQCWRWIGVAMIAFGLLLRAWGMRALGSAFTRTLRTLEDQRVIEHGPYRLIRHPGYAGSLLVWIGYGLGSGNWIVMLTIGTLLIAAYGWRINAEERLLLRAFGQRYADYQRRTKRLVPFLY